MAVNRVECVSGGRPKVRGTEGHLLAAALRRLLAGGGALVVSFALRPEGIAATAAKPAPAAPAGPDLPGSLKKLPLLDGWIRIDAKGNVVRLECGVTRGPGFWAFGHPSGLHDLDASVSGLRCPDGSEA